MLNRVLGFTVGLLSLVAPVQAQVLSIPPRTYGLSPIAGKVTAVEQRRTSIGNTVTGAETRVTLEFILAGCLDNLMPLITHSEIRGSRLTLYVTALNAHNETSKVARCVAIPKASAQIKVPGAFQQRQIQVVFLGQSESTSGNRQN